MLQLSFSVCPTARVVAIGKGPQVLAVKNFDSEIEDEDPLPSGALAHVLTENKLHPTEIKKITVIDSLIGFQGEKPGWLQNLKRDWTVRSGIRSFFRDQISSQLAVEFVHPEKARLSFLTSKSANQEALLWNFFSANKSYAESVWFLKNGNLFRQGTLATGLESIESFFRSVAEFCGFTGDDGFFRFFELSHLGEPSYLNNLLEDFLFLDEFGQFRLVFEDGRNDALTLDDRIAALSDWLGSPQRDSSAPISTRELALSATCAVLLQKWVKLKVEPWLFSKGKLQKKILITGTSPLVNLVVNELRRIDQSHLIVEVFSEPEAEIEAVGALKMDQMHAIELNDGPMPPYSHGSAAL